MRSSPPRMASGMLYAEDTAKLKRIEEDAEIADRAFRKFREMQTEHGMDASDLRQHQGGIAETARRPTR